MCDQAAVVGFKVWEVRVGKRPVKLLVQGPPLGDDYRGVVNRPWASRGGDTDSLVRAY